MTHTLASTAQARAGREPTVVEQFDPWYREHAPLVLRALARYGVSNAALDDCAQEVFLTALRRWEAGEVTRPQAPWLYGVARRIASHHHRASDRKQRRERVGASPEPPDSPEAHTDARLLADRVAAFIARLDEKYREPFVLSEVEGLTAPQIAEALELKLNTVYTRVARARRMFRTELAAHSDQGGQP